MAKNKRLPEILFAGFILGGSPGPRASRLLPLDARVAHNAAVRPEHSGKAALQAAVRSSISCGVDSMESVAGMYLEFNGQLKKAPDSACRRGRFELKLAPWAGIEPATHSLGNYIFELKFYKLYPLCTLYSH